MEAIDEIMTGDPMVFMLGEDVGKAWGAICIFSVNQCPLVTITT